MLEFEWPWMFYLIPLPLVMWLLPARNQQEAALKVPFYDAVNRYQHTAGFSRNTKYSQWLALWIIWLLLLVAGANPQLYGEPISVEGSGRDLLLAVDISGSMETPDMVINRQPVNRLIAVKAVIGDFVESRGSDRLGLILFGSQAYLQAPLTYDRNTVGQLLKEAEIGFAGGGTAIGDAIGLAVKRLRNHPENQRVLVLLTDGANTSGELAPLRAAELASKENIKIYTIGFGADEMTTQGFFGPRTINPSADLDEDAMRTIAEITGGQYFRARNLEELVAINQALDKLEPVALDTQTFRPVKSLFYWPLTAALALTFLWSLLSLWSNRRTNHNAAMGAIN